MEWGRKLKTKRDRICERDRRSGSSLRLRDENTKIKLKKNKTKSKLALVTSDVGYCYSFVRYQSKQNEDIPESRGKILALLLATFDWYILFQLIIFDNTATKTCPQAIMKSSL